MSRARDAIEIILETMRQTRVANGKKRGGFDILEVIEEKDKAILKIVIDKTLPPNIQEIKNFIQHYSVRQDSKTTNISQNQLIKMSGIEMKNEGSINGRSVHIISIDLSSAQPILNLLKQFGQHCHAIVIQPIFDSFQASVQSYRNKYQSPQIKFMIELVNIFKQQQRGKETARHSLPNKNLVALIVGNCCIDKKYVQRYTWYASTLYNKVQKVITVDDLPKKEETNSSASLTG